VAPVLAAAAGGVVFALSSPPFDFVAGILIGLALFAWSLDGGAARGKDGFARGWVFGLAANLVALRFVPEVVTRFTPLPGVAAWTALVLLAAAQALVWGAGGAIARSIARRVPGAPAWLAFGIGVYLATFVPAIFPWTPAGGLSPWPVTIQLADVVGERGVTFVIAIACGLAASAARSGLAARAERGASAASAARGSVRAAAAQGGIAAAILVFVVGFGALRMSSIDARRAAAPHARVALVQPGFEASDRWDPRRAAMMLERLTKLTRAAESRGADLVVWPESAYPYTLHHGAKRAPVGFRAVLQDGVHGPVLTGVYMDGGPGGGGTNSAVLATTDGALSRSYDKRHLLWFGETVPLSDTFPWLRRAFARGTGLEPGHESVAFVVGPIRAAVLNCYEDTLPVAGREAMDARPNLLVNLTNDAWFFGTAESELHLRLAVLRAVETRRDLARAVNRGPTSLVDAAGRVSRRYEADLPKSITVEPALLDGPPTFYARFGDAPLLVLVAASIATALVRARRARARAWARPERATTPDASDGGASAQNAASAAPAREAAPATTDDPEP
jgi:apolipoprotein N-acyltransferase